MFETLLLAREAGVAVRQLPFIGMGGVRYIDMLLARKVAGMSDFVSLEHDRTLWKRCALNKPFAQMEIYEGSAADYLAKVGLRRPAVIWFDIEKMASKDARDDIISLATGAKPGSFVFVTAGAEMPVDLRAVKGKDRRLAQLKEKFAPLADKVPESWLGANEFHRASAHLAIKFLRFGFAGRADGVFRPLINLTYKDSAWMATVGGFFGPEAQADGIRRLVREHLKFAMGHVNDAPFEIEQFNITDAERLIFDRSASAPPRSRRYRNQLAALGFRPSVIDQYTKLVRFIPRYVEAAF